MSAHIASEWFVGFQSNSNVSCLLGAPIPGLEFQIKPRLGNVLSPSLGGSPCTDKGGLNLY